MGENFEADSREESRGSECELQGPSTCWRQKEKKDAEKHEYVLRTKRRSALKRGMNNQKLVEA